MVLFVYTHHYSAVLTARPQLEIFVRKNLDVRLWRGHTAPGRVICAISFYFFNISSLLYAVSEN
jgi:hypothetical protein